MEEKERKNYQGMISVSRVTSGSGKPFYGSKVLHNAHVRIDVCEASNKRELGSDHYHPDKLLASVEMSPIQWADLITNMNSMGVPCTIKSIGNEKMENPEADIIDPVRKIKKDAEGADDRVKERIRDVKKQLKSSADSKKPISPSLAKELYAILEYADENYESDRKFYKKQAHNEIQQMLVEAVNSAESRINNTIMALGLEAAGIKLPAMITAQKDE